MSSSRRSPECRASLLALAIASAGASIHLGIELAVDESPSDADRVRVRCPSEDASTTPEPSGAIADPAYLEAVELRCRAAGAASCDVAQALPLHRAIEASATLFETEVPDHAFLRFSPTHQRVVWTLRAQQAGLTANVDAFDLRVVEFTADGVTTN